MNSMRLEPINSNSVNVINETQNQNEDVKRNQTSPTSVFPKIDLHIDLQKINKVFDSYATKKTIATGFFNLALVATNFAQMKYLISAAKWTGLNITLLTFVCISLLLQFGLSVLLVFLAKQGEFIDEEKREQLIRSNNISTLIALAISVINIFLNIFIYGF